MNLDEHLSGFLLNICNFPFFLNGVLLQRSRYRCTTPYINATSHSVCGAHNAIAAGPIPCHSASAHHEKRIEKKHCKKRSLFPLIKQVFFPLSLVSEEKKKFFSPLSESQKKKRSVFFPLSLSLRGSPRAEPERRRARRPGRRRPLSSRGFQWPLTRALASPPTRAAAAAAATPPP